MTDILLGFESKTGNEVKIPLSHIVVTGVTQLSGKTTTLEALLTRAQMPAIVFKTKPGEKGFSQGELVPPYFKEKSDWQYVSGLLEAMLKEKLKFERSWIITACKGTSSLVEVKHNVEEQLANPKLGGLNRSVYTTLDAYLKIILPQLSTITFSSTLDLGPGINIMDLQRMKYEMQSLVIRSVLEVVLKERHGTIVVIPEAWNFLPQDRGNPAKQAAEDFIRQGATNKNFLWIDSQDITGVDKTPLKSVSTWILGIQSERNEVHHTIEQMPVPKKFRPPEEDIMTLQKGHFFVCTPSMMKKVYVQPAWLEDYRTAMAVAMGQLQVSDLIQPTGHALPPLARIPEIKEDPKFRSLEELRKEMLDVRKDFVARLHETHIYVAKLAETVNDIMLKLAAQDRVAPVNIDEIVVKVLSKLPGTLQPKLSADPEMMKQIVEAVLKKIPANSDAISYTVEPLVALQKKFQEGAKEMIVNQIKALTGQQLRILAYVESAGKKCSQTELAMKCLGLVSGEGGNGTRVREMVVALDGGGLLKRDSKHATTEPNLRARIKDLMAVHGTTDEEVDQVYKHIVAELLSVVPTS